MSDPISLTDLILQGGAVGVLAFVVIAFMKGWIIRGSEAVELRKERDRALDLVFEQAQLAKRAIELSEKAP